MTFEEARAQFPVLERVAYLNAGAMGPLATATAAAMAEQARADLEDGRGSKRYFEAMLMRRQEVRERLAGLVGAEVDRLALTTSTTDGCNIVLSGLDLGPEDDVVTTDSEHPGAAVAARRVRCAHPVSIAKDGSFEPKPGAARPTRAGSQSRPSSASQRP
jgi:L-cysteine/cystine lyase